MEEIVIVRTGEIALKSGGPRIDFEQTLFSNIMNFLSNKGIGGTLFKTRSGRIVARVPEGRGREACAVISRVFGVASVSPAIELDFSPLEALLGKCLEEVKTVGRTFAVRAKRAGKLPFTSQEFAAALGGEILEKFPEAKVDLTNPESEIFVDLREDASYIYFERIPGAGGIPYGIEGRALVLLDGSGESVLAGLEAAKRGCSLEFFAPADKGRKSAEILGRALDFFPKKKLRVSVLAAGARPEEIALARGCMAIVTGKSSGAPEREFGILELCPLSFLSRGEIGRLGEKYFSENQAEVVERENFFEVARAQ
ncbi:MAG: THUMP domain-containing protein [archaeon]